MNPYFVLTAVTALAAGMALAGGSEENRSTRDVPAIDEQDREVKTAIGCRLSPGARARRDDEIQALFAGTSEVLELEDGYAFRFPGEGEWADKLLGFVIAERQCCQFFTFELTFEPHQGPVWLRVRGSQEIKALLEALCDSAG